MSDRSAAERWGRRVVRSTFGVWPVYEARNKLLGWPGALRLARTESREARRLRDQVPSGPVEMLTVIPTYRRPEQLRRAVDSALRQDIPHHLILVIADGGALPELPDDPRLVAVSLPENTGHPSMVRNIALRLVPSRYASFLDDDNEWTDDHLSTAMDAMDDGAEVVYTAVERLFPDGGRMDVLAVPFDRRRMAEQSFIDTNSLVVRRSRAVRFSRIPRTRKTLPKEDWELVWRLSRHGHVVHVPRITVRYTVNPRSYYTPWDADLFTAADRTVDDLDPRP